MILRGDDIATERFVLFQQYYDELVRHLTAKLRSRDQAQDIAQETFLRVLAQDSSVPIEQPRAFLYKTAFNLTVDLFRRQQRRAEEPLDAESAYPAFITPAEQETVVSAKEQVRLLYDALMELPPRCRHVFLLHKFKDRSHAEIAAQLGISISMVEKHILKATSFCRERFSALKMFRTDVSSLFSRAYIEHVGEAPLVRLLRIELLYFPRMTQQSPPSASDALRKQAIGWMVRLHSGSATSGDRQAFDAWLAASPEHRREFETVSRMWAVLDDTQSLLHAEIQKAEDLWTSHEVSRQRERRWWWPGTQAAIIGSALMLLIITAWWWTGRPETMLYETAKGAQRQVTLTDGSSVALNTDTRLTVEFSRDQRSIRLDRGEAWFTVSHDERRPFTVQVENSTIRDIGTQFIVNKSPEDVLVSVLEGTVEVKAPEDRADTPMPRPAILHAGQQLSYGTDGRMSDIRVFDQDRVGSWKEGKLVFRSQPLKQVLEEIARYRPEDIRLLDQTLNELPVSGVFNIQELDHAIETLQAALPIHAEHVRDNLILIERAPAELQSRALSKGGTKGSGVFS